MRPIATTVTRLCSFAWSIATRTVCFYIFACDNITTADRPAAIDERDLGDGYTPSSKRTKRSNVTSARLCQATYKREIVKLINCTMAKHGNSFIIELDDIGLRLYSIMGKKKYWKVIENDNDATVIDSAFVTKGFEKNAQAFIKHIVRVLQINTLEYIERFVSNGVVAAATGTDSQSSILTFRLVIDNVRSFFCAIYSTLHEYYKHHGLESFAFGMALNPRITGVYSADACFMQDLARYNFAIGDRARCVFALTIDDPTETRFMHVRDLVKSRDSINYYKVVRRLTIYLLQNVECFKRV